MPNLLINVTTKGVKGASTGIKKLSGSLMSLTKVAMVGATGGAVALGVAMKKATDAAAEQELQERKLAQALGTNTDALLAQAGALQQTSRFGDEAIIQQQAYLASIGMSEKQIKEMIPVTLDLAAATGMSLESAVKNTAKTLSGMTGELGESVGALKGLTAEQLKAGEGIEVMRDLFKGAAEAEIDTFTGAMDQAKNAVGDAAESLGSLLLPMAKDGAKALKSFSEDAIEAFDFLGKIDFSATFENIKTNFNVIGQAIIDSFKVYIGFLPEIFSSGFKTVVEVVPKIFNTLFDWLKQYATYVFEPIFIGGEIVWTKIKQSIAILSANIQNVFITAINFIKDKYNSLAETTIGSKLGLESLELTDLVDVEGVDAGFDQMITDLQSKAMGTDLMQDLFGGEDNVSNVQELADGVTAVWSDALGKLVVMSKETGEEIKNNTNPNIVGGGEDGDVESAFDKQVAGWQEGLNKVGSTVGASADAIGGLYNALYENKKMWRDKDMNNEIKMVQQSKLSEEEKNAKIQNIREKYNQKDLDAKKAMKPVKYAEAISNIALGVSNALSAAPPPLNIALAAITAAAGAVQLSTIASSEYAQGGLVGGKRHSQGGTLIEAEQGEFVMRRSAVNRLGVSAMNAINQGMYENGGLVSNRIANITNINAPNQEPQQEVANVTVNVSGNVMSQDYVEGELAEQIKDAVRRGADFGVI